MALRDDILKIRQLMDKRANMSDILKAYSQALDDVRTEMAKIYAQHMVDGKLQVNLQQRYTILQRLEKKLTQMYQKLGEVDFDTTSKILYDIYSESYYRTAYAIDRGMTVEIAFNILPPEMINAAVNTPIDGTMFSDRIWHNKEVLVNRLRNLLEKAIIQGTDPQKLAKLLKDEFGVSANESKRLINTELARVVSQANDSIYKQSKVVTQVMWDSTLDNKTSQICRHLDGQKWNVNANHPTPPAHPHCRSCLIPIVPGWKPTIKRENIKGSYGNKPIINYSTYETWKKSRNID
ncbi:minor capsid protein [Sporolactobacillus laevolacticus]|uniref:minor capsid protein n=1 Tax=Sporolactobacillus laevolacticus TaxID=33018 RepID=UPI0025B36B4A|nr:minor capsid protein [Sporolactobacillus laevolacticus]MDN3956193.1 minor capsid protein [Sporolactobacillus laevolacticus]